MPLMEYGSYAAKYLLLKVEGKELQAGDILMSEEESGAKLVTRSYASAIHQILDVDSFDEAGSLPSYAHFDATFLILRPR